MLITMFDLRYAIKNINKKESKESVTLILGARGRGRAEQVRV